MTASQPEIAPAPDYSEMMSELRAAFGPGRTRDPSWRESQLRAMVRMLREREDEFAQALKADLNKPAFESWGTEISYVIDETEWFRKRFRKFMRPRKVSTPVKVAPGRSWTEPEPLGVVLVMSAWNYPLQLALAPAVPAIAAGNCVVIKPSELAPATSAALARWVPEYLDPECIRVVEGSVPETTGLLAQRFDHIIYTGGASVARIVMTAAAKHLTPVTLELGGKSPCIVMPDANLEVAARRIAWGRFMNAGQTCVAPDYVLTDAETESKLVPLLEKNIRKMFGDDPSKSDSYGRIVNERHFDRIRSLIDPERVAIGGDSDSEARYIGPTVMTGVSKADAAMGEEIFGPVLPIVRSDTLSDAIEFIRSGEKPLAAYLFTGNGNDERQFLAKTSSGSACVNDVVLFMGVPELPFGGVGESGMGQYKGFEGFKRLSHNKAILRKAWWPDPPIRYAPYTDRALRWLKRLG